MSYILDALRKAERERRQPEVPNINYERATERSSRYHWSLILLVILISVNLAWFVYHALGQKTTHSDISAPVTKISNAGFSSNTPDQILKVTQQTHSEANVLGKSRQTADQKQANNSPQSIAELMASNKQQQTSTVSETGNQMTFDKTERMRSKSAVANAKINLNTQRQTKGINADSNARVKNRTNATKKQSKQHVEKNKLLRAQTQKVRQTPPIFKKKVRRNQKKIPMLRQMSSEFQHQIPQLDINVYVHSEDAEAAFVIISMRKYRIGDWIEEDLKLVDIGNDSMVLSKDGKQFRIARP